LSLIYDEHAVFNPFLSVSRRTRATPFTRRVTAAGVKAYTVYNHMLLPTVFESFEADYWHLCEKVQVWDVAAERQVEIIGPDSDRLVQLMTPRDIRKAQDGQCFYIPLCDEKGQLVNDPIAIRLSTGRWWISIADSDVRLWAKGLATGYGLDVEVFEPDVSPLAIQGPLAEDLVARVFDESIRDIRFFRGRMMKWREHEFFVARSGWSKQGGFEIYLSDSSVGEALWDDCFAKGADLDVRAGCPNLIERIENGLISFGNDVDFSNNPYESALGRFIDLDADIESLSLPALRILKDSHEQRLVGLVFDHAVTFDQTDVEVEGRKVGEVRSHCWSPRYQKNLAFAMVEREFDVAGGRASSNGIEATIQGLPFDPEVLK
jgi:dimethylsulfoniopropionate demethylase